MDNYIGDGRGFIYCSECGKLIGVYYGLDKEEYVLQDSFCIECHNRGCEAEAKEQKK